MASELQTYSLSDLGKIVTGKTPPAKIKTAYADGHGTLFVTPRDMDGRRWIDSTERYLSGEGLLSVQRNQIPSGSIAVSCIGSDMGKAVLVKDNSVTNQQINSLLVDETRFNPLYVYYVLSTKQQYLKDIAGGSATPILNKTDFGKVTIQLPLKVVQDEIANLLDAFDSKIELNRQINQTLEQMAQTLFNSWFVDFDPVMDNALDAGNPIPDELQHRAEARKAVRESEGFKPLPDNVRQLFPDAFEESELGWVPKGWEVVEIKAHCSKIQNGGTPKRSEKEYWDNGTIPWLTSGEVRQSMITNVENRITEAGLTNSSAKWVPEGSTLVALYGATAGEVSTNAVTLTTNQAVCALVPKKNYRWLNYLQVRVKTKEMQSKAVGSAQQNISKGLVESLKVISPSNEILITFNKLSESYFAKAIDNNKSIGTLTLLRDTLLPKLISGELRLDDVEVAVEQETISA
ncbi:TPA: restriction endonuclease subunit S [Vibrio vulnificus]|nr:restriction endonuclease subunit S [Vibrio vulnificus]HAS6304120.1 restriction endonuclease subunit S [Vibrio vulnificus]HDY7598524.1 restriction endonuclease subunit S [Vibrio vulnificus]